MKERTDPGPVKPSAGLAISALVKVPDFSAALRHVSRVRLWPLADLQLAAARSCTTSFSLNQRDAAFNATVFLQGATLIGLIGGGMLADLLYRRTKAARLWLLTASMLLCAPCLHLLGNSDTLAMTRVAAAGFGLFSGLLMGNIFPAAFEFVPADTRASAVGVLNFCGGMMSGLATFLGGLWKKSLGIDRLLTLTAVAYVIAGVALLVGIQVLFQRDYEKIH